MADQVKVDTHTVEKYLVHRSEQYEAVQARYFSFVLLHCFSACGSGSEMKGEANRDLPTYRCRLLPFRTR